MDSRFAVLKRSPGTRREIPAKAQRRQGAQGRLEAGVSGGGCSKCTLPGVLAARKPVQGRGRRPEGEVGRSWSSLGSIPGCVTLGRLLSFSVSHCLPPPALKNRPGS